MNHRALMLLMSALLLVPACDAEPNVRDDGSEVLVLDEHTEGARTIRTIEVVEPAADLVDDLVSVAPELSSFCVCTGCQGPCDENGGLCLTCWPGEETGPISPSCCRTCYEGLPVCPPLNN